MLFASANEKGGLRPPQNHPIGQGHALTLYMAVEFERYWAEGMRTFAVNEASFSEIASVAADVFNRVLETVKAGNAVSQVYRAVVAGARQSGLDLLPDYGLGNGIGLSLNEAPIVKEKGARKLKEGICLALRLAVKDKTFGRVMFGNTLFVGKHGAEIVT